jgi:glycosyltransferase 2 family protein
MEPVEAPRRRRTPKWLVPAIGYTISAISLIWVFSKFPYAQLGDHLRTMNWSWVAVAVTIEVAIYFFDAWRWRALLRPVGAPSFGICLQAVFIGLFANDVLPAKAGELIRCFLLSYETRVPLSLAFTSDLILRIMDGMWIVIVYVLITLQIGTHVAVSRVMWGFGAGVVVVSGLVLFVLFRRQHAHYFVKNTSWAARFVHLLDEIHRLGHWRELGLAMLGSGFYWLAQVLAVWALTKADAFDLGLSAAAFLLVVKAVATLIPNAPASVGAYQAATMYALGLLLVERANAQIFAEIMFWFLTLPGAVGGAIAVAFAGFDITDLHRHAHEASTSRRLEEVS